jgi:hypothetical protein
MEKMERRGVIYKITSPNNKIYIGQTIDFTQRCRKYKGGFFEGQIKLWNSCKKHCWNPTQNIEVIEHCYESKLDEREIYWIQYFDSYIIGLNSDLGGKGRRGFKHTDETKQKIREKKIGQKHTIEAKKKISEASRNISDETRLKMSKSSLGRKHTDESKQKISQANTGKTLNEEQRKKVSEANKGNKKRLGKKHSIETKQKISNSKKGIPNIKLSSKIICLNNGLIFNSQAEASEKMNLNQPNISRVCQKQRKTYKGLIFMFYDEYLKKNKNE